LGSGFIMDVAIDRKSGAAVRFDCLETLNERRKMITLSRTTQPKDDGIECIAPADLSSILRFR